ncbi:MAP/microtubule affinity-regulating kinase 4 [Coemansia sp. Benny D115]|nr:MAP/microtubule affinity-regulating kinase 4 [Coemansia sp. Benny D115]
MPRYATPRHAMAGGGDSRALRSALRVCALHTASPSRATLRAAPLFPGPITSPRPEPPWIFAPGPQRDALREPPRKSDQQRGRPLLILSGPPSPHSIPPRTMTTAAVRPASNYHGSDQPDIAQVNSMQRRRSFAPTNFADYHADSKPAASAADSYQATRTMPPSGTEKQAWGYTPSPPQQQHQPRQHNWNANWDQQKQQKPLPTPHQGSPATDNSIPQYNPQQQRPRTSAQSTSTSRREMPGRNPGPRERREQRIGEFIIKQTLGKGTFSKVCMAEHRATKQKFALKFIKPTSPQGGSTDKHNIRVEREIKLLSLLYHPNIVRLYDVVQTPKFTMIVMEHNSGGELLHYIRKRGRLHENEARGFFRQIVSAMDYTHRNCIIHRDLKLENVMLDHESRIRIIDFGFANTFEWDKQLATFCGSPFYAAPEMVNGIKYTGPEVDIWSMGVILFFMLCGRTPFEGENLKEIYDKISRGRFSMPPYLTKEAQHLLQQMLTVNPKQRISMKGIVDHAWTNKECDQQIDNHLPARPTVVLQPNEQSLNKMRVYKYEVDAVASALAHSDMALTPMVCIYHLVEESRRRKATRNARRSQAANLGGTSGTGSTVDVDHVSPVPPQSSASTPTNAPSGLPADGARPTSRGRPSFNPAFPDASGPGSGPAFGHSPTAKAQPQVAPLASDPRHKAHQNAHPHAATHMPQPPTQFLGRKDSDVAANLDSPSFGASQYEPPRLRKGSTASGQLSVSSSINLEASSPFLRDDEKRFSRSSRFMDRVRKSMPFLKLRRSQVLEDVPAFDQSQHTVGNRNNRVSFFQAPFRRFSAAPSALSLNQSPGNRVQSYYPPSNPPPPPTHAQVPQRSHPAGARPATANVEARQMASPKQRPSTSGGHGPSHRYTDFGPLQQHNPSPRLPTAESGDRHRKSEPIREIPYDNSSSEPVPSGQKRAQRPLSVMSNRQVTPLRLHPTQSLQPAQQTPPFTQQTGAVQQLPAALMSRGSAPSGVGMGSGNQANGNNNNGNNKTAVRGIFNLRYTMLGPIGEIHAKIERVLKSKSIEVCKMADRFYSCKDQGLSFEIFVDTVQGHLHTIRFKRVEGSWWVYKKLTFAITNELQGLETNN